MPPRKRKAAPARRASARPARAVPAPVRPGPGEYLWVLAVPYDERQVATAYGARWDPSGRQTVYVGVRLPRELLRYAAPAHSWERYKQDQINGLPPAGPPAPRRLTPRPRQVEAARAIEAAYLAGYPGFIEMDEVGTGKCVGPDTRILLNNAYVRAEDAWERYASETRWSDDEGEWAEPAVPLITTGNVDGRAKQVAVGRMYRQQISEQVRRITLADGSRITVTRRHKLLTPNGWTRHLTVGDFVGVPSTVAWNGLQIEHDSTRPLARGDSWWVPVVNIENVHHDGWVYDFEIPDGHNYVAAGMWCHNTLSTFEGLRRIASHKPLRNILIGCPLTAVPHWRNTVTDQGDLGARVVVVNYDRFKQLLTIPPSAAAAKKTSTKNKRIASDGQPSVQWDAIIYDECHLLKTIGTGEPSQRAAAAAKLARYAAAAKDKPFVVWASATPATKPPEFGYAAPLFAHLTGGTVKEFNDFGGWLQKEGFQVVPTKKFGIEGWDWTPNPADTAKIKALLFDRPVPAAIRRLPGWDEVQRIPVPVELDPVERLLYDQAWIKFRHEMNLARRGRDSKAKMVARLRFRQKASLLRVPTTVEHVMGLLDNGRQVAVSVQFLETLDAIRDALTARKVAVAEISGRLPVDEKETNRLAFQRGQAQVVLFTVTAAISLHAGEMLADGSTATTAPRATVVHDPRYSAIDSAQIEGRCHRDGQIAPSLMMHAAGTVEGAVVSVMIRKLIGMKGMIGDDTTTLQEIDEALMNDPVLADDPMFVPQPEQRLVSAATLPWEAAPALSDSVSRRPGAAPALTAPARTAPAGRTGPAGRTAPALPRRGAPAAAPAPAPRRVVPGGLPTRPAERDAFKDELAGGRRLPTAPARLTAAEREALRKKMAGER